MASRFVLPFADVGSGIKPASGAQLFFFETGSSTPKATFSDEAATTPNSNPVISDANGLFSDIFLVDDYSVTLKDKNSVQIWGGVPVGEGGQRLQIVARSLNVSDSDVIFSTDQSTAIPAYIYSSSQQLIYGVPVGALGKFIDTVVGDVLTTTEPVVYTLQPLLPRTIYDSTAQVMGSTLLSMNEVTTQSFYGAWASTINGPKGGATYFRDGTTGSPSTLYPDVSGFFDAAGDGFSLPLRRNVDCYQFGGFADLVNDDTPAAQAMADFSKDKKMTIGFKHGDWLFNTTVDLSAAGAGDEGFRNLEVICDHEAYFYGLTNSISLFNVSGQRRFKFSGGWFKRANVCFLGNQEAAPNAYMTFRDIIFDGESTGAIQRCYLADTSIGVYWQSCQFGTDQANDQIDLAIELTGISSQQTNINKFINCKFINCVQGVRMEDSPFARLSTAFVDCWFESISGYAARIGSASRAVSFTRCYFEAVGTVTASPIVANDARIKFDDCVMVGLQGNDTAFIDAQGGTEIETEGHTDFGSINGRVFVMYDSDIAQPQYLNGLSITDNSPSGKTYKELLFTVTTPSDEQYINWEIPRETSTLADTQTKKVTHQNMEFKGFISHITEVVQLATQGTNFDIATINVPNAGNGFRVYVESYQTIQAVGHAGSFREFLVHWDGATWIFKSLVNQTTVVGFTFNLVNIGSSSFKIQAARSLGGATNTPFRALITIRQAADNMEGNEVSIT